jgi:hypothetical protein
MTALKGRQIVVVNTEWASVLPILGTVSTAPLGRERLLDRYQGLKPLAESFGPFGT